MADPRYRAALPRRGGCGLFRAGSGPWRGGRLLYSYARKDALSMELSVSAETGDRAWRFDTPLYRMTADGKRVVAAEQNGMTFWYCDGLVYLDNGRAWTVGGVMPDHTALLEDAVALFRASEITVSESPGEKIYTIDTDGATAQRLIGNFLPWTEISLERIETARLELVERDGELYALRFTAEGELSSADELERGEAMPSGVSALLLLRTGAEAPELPTAVKDPTVLFYREDWAIAMLCGPRGRAPSSAFWATIFFISRRIEGTRWNSSINSGYPYVAKNSAGSFAARRRALWKICLPGGI